MHNFNTDMFYCLLCRRIQQNKEACLIYKTGYKAILEEIYRAGVCLALDCKTCHEKLG